MANCLGVLYLKTDIKTQLSFKMLIFILKASHQLLVVLVSVQQENPVSLSVINFVVANAFTIF